MQKIRTKIENLISLALDSPESNEGRTAAIQAVKLIKKSGFIDSFEENEETDRAKRAEVNLSICKDCRSPNYGGIGGNFYTCWACGCRGVVTKNYGK